MRGTRFLAKAEALDRYSATEDLGSLSGSTAIADSFNEIQSLPATQSAADYISDTLYK